MRIFPETSLADLMKGFVIFLVISYPLGCWSPYQSGRLHSRIRVGMTIDEVFNTMPSLSLGDVYLGKVSIPVNDPDGRWETFKIEVGRIQGNDRHSLKWHKFGSKQDYESQLIFNRPDYIQIIKYAGKDPERYSALKTQIGACLMGPVFQKNGFDIKIDLDGKVTDVTKLEHWD